MHTTTNKNTSTWTTALNRTLILTSTFLAALALQAQQTDNYAGKEKTSAADDPATCLKEAGEMNAATIKFGQLASQKAQNQELRRFGERLEKDHQMAQAKLESIASKHNLTLPTSLRPECKEELTKLQALSGSEFDKEFAKGAVQGHAQAVAKLQEATVKASDPDFVEYAKDMLPKVKRHQERAREIAKAVGLDEATIAGLEKQPPAGVGTSGTSSQSESGAAKSRESNSESKDASRQP